MNDIQKHYALWDNFLELWPISRLAKMSLNEYTQAGSKDSFTYWIESELDELGSIWGGSSFKFGIFSRKDTEDKQSDVKLSYSEVYGWYSSLGETAEVAFKKVRGFVAQVADWASKGDMDAIESFQHLGEAFKWKIAFHYQNRKFPMIVDVFKRAPLAVFVGESSKQDMAKLQKLVMEKRPSDVGILEFGRQVWHEWSNKNLPIWKLSHGQSDFSVDERNGYLQAKLGVMDGNTGKKQGEAFKKIPVGTLFYLCFGNSSLQLIGQFISEAEPSSKGKSWLQRHYRVLKKCVKFDSYEGDVKGWTPNYNSTFRLVSANYLPQFEKDLLKPFFDTDLAELAILSGETIDMTTLNSSNLQSIGLPDRAQINTVAELPRCFNRIYYGPPGTGKTYTLMKLLKRDYETQIASDSIEELQTKIMGEDVENLSWWKGIAAALYDLGGKASVSDLEKHLFIQAIALKKGRTKEISETLWGELQRHTINSSQTVTTTDRHSPFIFDKTDNSVWQFAGDWQSISGDLTALVKKFKVNSPDNATLFRYSFVTFHQSYGYEEFVEGLRPVLSETDEDGTGGVKYEIRSGAFKELCHRARQFPHLRFAMVIDEINRGNISKILGELITLIEPDKRDPLNGNKPPIELVLSYSGEKFSVPVNIDIIGTMNTTDRSLALLDNALRRRFDFVPLLPDTRAEKDSNDPDSAPLAGLVVTTTKGVIDVRRMLERINERIEVLYDRDHCIGHSYFTVLIDVEDGNLRFEKLTYIFLNSIVPLLEEYFFEDWYKIRLVLGDNQKPEVEQFIIEVDTSEQDLGTLFGNNHNLDSYETKRRYHIQRSAFTDPLAYSHIYETLERG